MRKKLKLLQKLSFHTMYLKKKRITKTCLCVIPVECWFDKIFLQCLYLRLTTERMVFLQTGIFFGFFKEDNLFQKTQVMKVKVNTYTILAE